jgi:hypothetical protein
VAVLQLELGLRITNLTISKLETELTEQDRTRLFHHRGDRHRDKHEHPRLSKQYPVVEVTLGPADGNPQRRGPQVLVSRP